MRDIDGVQVSFRLRYRDETDYLTVIDRDERRVIRYDDGRYEMMNNNIPDAERRIEAVKKYRRQEYDSYVKWHGESDHALYAEILPFEE